MDDAVPSELYVSYGYFYFTLFSMRRRVPW